MTHQPTSLHIAYLTPEFVTEPKFDGGLANYLNRVTRYLREHSHRPEVFVLSDRNETIDHNGVPVHRVKQIESSGWNLFRRGLRRSTGISLTMSTFVREGSRILAQALQRRHQRDPFDVVQGSDFYATGLFVPRNRSYSLVTRLSYYAPAIREASHAAPTRDRLWMESLERQALRRSDRCYGPSRVIADVVQREVGVTVDVIRPPAEIEVLPAEEDDAVYQQQLAGKVYLVFFGRVCRLKGALHLAESIAPVLAEQPHLHLAVIGREDPPGIVAEMRTQLGAAADRLIHITRTPHTQLYPIIRRARAVVLPSLVDNFPNTCIEGMGLGKVVIGTREASFGELIDDGENGFLSSSQSAGDLRAVIRKTLALSESERQRMGSAAMRRIADFSADKTIPPLVDFYREVIASRHKKPLRRSAAAV